MAGNDPYAQIASGIVPDAPQPYNAQAEAQKKIDPYKQIALGIQPPAPTPYALPDSQGTSVVSYSPYSGQGTPEAESQEESLDSVYTPPTTATKPKAKGSLDWVGGAIQAVPGNVQHALQNEGFRQARRAIYGAGLPGEIAKDVGQFGMSAEKAGKGVLTHPRASIQPAIAGAASGAVGLVENPIALATNLAGGNYNKMVGGKPVQQRVLEGIGQGTEKKFPDVANVGGQAGNIAAGVLGGAALAPAAEALLAEKALPFFNNLLVKAGVKPAIQVLDKVAAQNPSLAYKIARGAATGGVLNAGFAAGGRGAYGQPMQATGKDVAEGALLGGIGGAFAKEGAPRVSETVHGEVVEPARIGEQPLPKRRRISDVKQQERGEPIVTPPPPEPAPEVSESERLRTQQPVAAIEDIPPYKRAALYPWQKSGYISQGMAPGGVAPDRARWNQTVQQAQQPQTQESTAPPEQRQVGQIVKPPEEAQPQIETPKRDIAQVIKPTKASKPFLWENSVLTPQQQFEIAVDQFYNTKSKKTADAAQAFIEQARSGKVPPSEGRPLQSEQAALGESEKALEPQLQGRVEETTEAESNRAQAMYEEAGVAPPREEEETQSFNEANPHALRQRVPVEELKEKNLETGHYTESFDESHNEPRRVKWNGRVHGAIPHPTDEGFGRLGGIIDDKGAVRERNVFGPLRKKTNMSSQLGATEPFTEDQSHANVRGQEEDLARKTPKAQAEAIHEASRRNKKIVAAADKGNPEEVAKATQQAAPKEKEVATPLQGDPLINAEALKGLMKDLLEESGSGIVGYPGKVLGAILKSPITIPKAIWNSRFSNEIVKPILEAKTSMDEVRTGTEKLGSSLANDMWKNFGAEALRGWGIKMTGQFGKEARKAMYKESVNDILNPNNHTSWTPQQRKAIAWKKYYRLKQRELINDFRKTYKGKIDPRLDKVLSDVHRGMLSPGERNYSGLAGWELLVEGLGHAAYHGIFFLNPKTHELILTHPLQTGSAVTSPIDIANAYRLMATNKTVKTFMKGMEPFTTDVRFEATKDFMDKAPWLKASTPLSKIVERDFMSGRLNNEVIGLAGMLKEHGQAKTLELMNDINRGADLNGGSMTFDERATMAASALQAIHDATGSGTAGVSRTQLQSSAIGRLVFQLSGYHQQIARFYASQAGRLITGKTFGERADAASKLGVMMAATTLMGGNLIPKEVNDDFDIAMIKASPGAYLAMQKMQDVLNLPKYLNADISEHVSNSFINWAGNIGLENAASSFRAAFHPNASDTSETRTRKVVIGLLMAGLPYLEGLPGASVASNVWKGAENLASGKKITSVYSGSPISHAGEYPIAKGEEQYANVWDGISHVLRDVLVMGKSRNEGNWAKQNQIADKFNRAGKVIPWDRLQADYPTTLAEAPR